MLSNVPAGRYFECGPIGGGHGHSPNWLLSHSIVTPGFFSRALAQFSFQASKAVFQLSWSFRYFSGVSVATCDW